MAETSSRGAARFEGFAAVARVATRRPGSASPKIATAAAGRLQVKKYLLDTNVVSELQKPRPHGAVVAWLSELREEQIFVSAVTIGELQAGVERVRGQDPSKAQAIEAWVDQLARSLNVLPMDGLCFREWGRLIRRQPDHVIEDMMIAATARVHNLIVATRNERDFSLVKIDIVNPFKPFRA